MFGWLLYSSQLFYRGPPEPNKFGRLFFFKNSFFGSWNIFCWICFDKERCVSSSKTRISTMIWGLKNPVLCSKPQFFSLGLPFLLRFLKLYLILPQIQLPIGIVLLSIRDDQPLKSLGQVKPLHLQRVPWLNGYMSVTCPSCAGHTGNRAFCIIFDSTFLAPFRLVMAPNTLGWASKEELRMWSWQRSLKSEARARVFGISNTLWRRVDMHQCISLAAQICYYLFVICKHTCAVLEGLKGLIACRARQILHGV